MSVSCPTQQRVLQAACRVFAEKGYRDATIAEICEQAQANIAAVNYHFRDKERLYDAVWNHAYELAKQAYPIDGYLPEKPTLEDYIYSYARAMLHRIFSETEAGTFARLLYREIASPTFALDHISKEVLAPMSLFLSEVLQSKNPSMSEEQLRLCMFSIIGMCAFYNYSRPMRERIMGCKAMSDEEIEKTARHIAVFSIGGVEALTRERRNEHRHLSVENANSHDK